MSFSPDAWEKMGSHKSGRDGAIQYIGKVHIQDVESQMALTSMRVFRRFLIRRKNGTIDASAINSIDCYEAWLASRKRETKHPEKAFQRTLTGHLTGADGRVPFSIDEEKAILDHLRQRERWPCFTNSTTRFGEQGFRTEGYHERKDGTVRPSKVKSKADSVEDDGDDTEDGTEDSSQAAFFNNDQRHGTDEEGTTRKRPRMTKNKTRGDHISADEPSGSLFGSFFRLDGRSPETVDSQGFYMKTNVNLESSSSLVQQKPDRSPKPRQVPNDIRSPQNEMSDFDIQKAPGGQMRPASRLHRPDTKSKSTQAEENFVPGIREPHLSSSERDTIEAKEIEALRDWKGPHALDAHLTVAYIRDMVAHVPPVAANDPIKAENINLFFRSAAKILNSLGEFTRVWFVMYNYLRMVVLSKFFSSGPSALEAQEVMDRFEKQYPGQYVLLFDLTQAFKNRIILQNDVALHWFGRISKPFGGFNGMRFYIADIVQYLRVAAMAYAYQDQDFHWRTRWYRDEGRGSLEWFDVVFRVDSKARVLVERGTWIGSTRPDD